MKKRSMKRALSAVLTLCMALPGASVAFGSASAATVSDDIPFFIPTATF